MNMLKISALVGASMLVAPTAMAKSILIDDFDVFQQVADAPTVGLSASDDIVGQATILGEARRLETTNVPGGLGGSSLISTGGSGFLPANSLRFNVDSGEGTATVTYGIEAGGNALGDLTLGGVLDRFLFSDIVGDLAGASLLSTMTSTTNDVFSFLEPLAPGVASTTKFSGFSLNGDGVTFATLTDFSSVASLSFKFTGPKDDPNTPNNEATFDGSISKLSVVPLPASILFLLGGLGGLAGVSAASKRRRKA